jgi:hypothetical protein
MKMFAEYKIKDEAREQYLQLARVIRDDYPAHDVLIYEGVGQAGLFVEEWHDCDEAFFATLRQQRLAGDHSLWLRLDAMIVGGRSKSNIWLFKPLF